MRRSSVASSNKAADITEFLESLCMEIDISERTVDNYERGIQLINKTNQFNSNGVRRSDDEFNTVLRDGGKLFTASLKDKNGDHGEVLAILMDEDHKALSFVMSCRVFERKVEFFIMDKIIEKLKKSKIKFIECLFIKTNRNSQFENYYDLMGFKNIKNTNNKKFYRLNINEYKKIDFYIK